MAAVGFLDVFEEETNKMKENAVAMIIRGNYTKTIILFWRSKYF